MTWQLFVLGYLTIGVIFLIVIERNFRSKYRGDLYEFLSTQVPETPFDIMPLIRLVVVFVSVFLWPYSVIKWGSKLIQKRLGTYEIAELEESLKNVLLQRKEELKALDDSAKLRQHYLDIVNEAKDRNQEN